MKSVFEYIFLKKRVILLALIACIAFVSLCMQGITLYKMYRIEQRLNAFPLNKQGCFLGSDTTTQVISPHGTRSEIRSVYQDGQWKTETVASPITEEEVRAAQDAWEKRQDALREYWNQQERLFNDMHRNFFW